MENVINSKVLAGKRGLIMGVANNMSIAWAIAELAHRSGAGLAFTFQGEALEKRVRPLAESINSTFVEPCDVTDSESLKRLFEIIKQKWGKLDFIVHAVAFSDKEELRGKYIHTTLKNFLNTMHISCYSLTEVARLAEDVMTDGGSILTLTYHGSTKVMPSYNVMGIAKAALEASVKYIAADLGPKNIRVNTISAGPIKTLAASGIGDFRTMLKIHESVSPLKRNTTQEDVAKSAIYLLSDMSSGVTGEIHYVDSGYSIMGMNLIENISGAQG
jgi:enoyl-[acyl-carrier protein] reductase I